MSRKSVGPRGATKVEALIATALAHHQAGRFDQAQALYKRIVAFEPAHPTALANLAMLN